MTQHRAPSLSKWPFLVGDILLLALAWWIVNWSPDPFAFWPLFFLVGCVAGGAWLAIIPFQADFRAALKLAEIETLKSVTQQINELQSVGQQVSDATGQWQDVQEKANQAVQAASEITERMTAESKAFAEFMQKANDSEKAHLRLETEKLRRNESEWLKVVVMIMDHVYALNLAAARSGKAGLIQQLSNFQRACRDTARLVGLVPIEVAAGEPYNSETQALPNPEETPASEAQVAETLATGFSYQGQVVRKPLVRLTDPSAEPETRPADLFSGESSEAHPPAPPSPNPNRPSEPDSESEETTEPSP